MLKQYPWSSFSAFLQAIEIFEKHKPPVLKASQLPFGDSYAAHIISNFRFFGFAGRNNVPTELFKDFLENSDKRSEMFGGILKDAYPEIFKNIQSTEEITDEHLLKVFSKLSASKYTKRKIIAFFKNAALYAGMPISATSRTRVPVSQDERPSLINEQNNGTGIDGNRNADTDYHLVSCLIQQLPTEGKWTQKQRDKWLAALTANIDLLVDIIPDNESHK